MAIADHYEMLGVDRDAEADQIRAAYRKLAQKYHPDTHPGNRDAEKRFKEIAEAYSILSDDANRRKYDAFRNAEKSGFKAEDFDVEEVQQSPNYTYPIADVSLELLLTKQELERGCLKAVAVSRSVRCPHCKGHGNLGSRLRCMFCHGGGCGNCGNTGSVVATCVKCFGRGAAKEQTRLVVTVPPATHRGTRQRFLASGILWERFAGMFYVDAFVRAR